MRETYRIYRWLVAVWLIMAGTIMSPVRAYTYATQPSAWRTTPTLSQDIAPSCTFRSTSSFTPVMGTSAYSSEVYTPGAGSPFGPRRSESNPWDEEEGDPTGPEVGQVDTPVGSPLVLLLFAVLFIVLKRKKSYAE